VFLLFVCKELGSERYLLVDLNQQCFVGMHLTWVLSFGLPVMALLVFGVPLAAFLMLYKMR
jgi:hypothetical protein